MRSAGLILFGVLNSAVESLKVVAEGTEIKEGETARLKCRPSGSNNLDKDEMCDKLCMQAVGGHVIWMIKREDKTETIYNYDATKGGTGITEGSRWTNPPNTYDIELKNAQRTDNGMYQCLIMDAKDGLETEYAELLVKVPPTKPEIIEPADHKLILNEEGRISCKSADGIPEPTYIWYKNDRLMPVDARKDTANFPNSTFTIVVDEHTNAKVIVFSKVVEGDAGNYKCTAENMVGKVMGDNVEITIGNVSVASVVGIVFGVIFGVALVLVIGYMVFKKLNDDQDDYDEADDGANDVMIGDQYDDTYNRNHSGSNRHEASLVV